MKLAFLFCVLSIVFAAATIASAAEPSSRDHVAQRPFVVGHRGMLQAAPENTLAGFRACLALRVGFEFDVRRTQDGKLVCVHDATLQRTAGGKESLGELSLADLGRVDVGSYFSPAFNAERVPTIEAILALAAEHSTPATLLAVDLKDSGSGVEDEVLRLAQRHRILERLVFIGATIQSPEIRQRLRGASDQVQAARLAATPEEVNAAIADPTAAWIYLRRLPDSDEVARIHRAKKRIFVAGPLFAGKETKTWAQAAELGVDAILTDYPLELAQQLRQVQTP